MGGPGSPGGLLPRGPTDPGKPTGVRERPKRVRRQIGVRPTGPLGHAPTPTRRTEIGEIGTCRSPNDRRWSRASGENSIANAIAALAIQDWGRAGVDPATQDQSSQVRG